jgi:hypothetical protein
VVGDVTDTPMEVTTTTLELCEKKEFDHFRSGQRADGT